MPTNLIANAPLSRPLHAPVFDVPFDEDPPNTPIITPRNISISTSGNRGNLLQTLCKKTGHIAHTLINRLKNVDGIDETAASLALIRGVTGPIAAEAVFAVGLPFVILGLVGMMEESAEARDALSDLLNEKKDLAGQARHLATNGSTLNGNDAQQIQALKIQIKNSLASMPNSQRRERTKEYVHLFAQLHNLDDQQTEKLLLRCAAPFGSFALGAMAAGMFPGLTWGAAEIGVRALGQTSPETASGVGTAPLAAQISASAGVAVSMVFAPANAAMVGYATLRGMAGHQKNQLLEKSRLQAKMVLGENTPAESGKIFDQYCRAEIRSNQWTHTQYGLLTATGQSALATSGGMAIAGFFGAAAAASAGTGGIALPIIGAAAAIGAAAMRIRGEMAREIRHGNPELPEIDRRSRVSGESTLEETKQSTVAEINSRLIQAHKDLAKNKLISLALNVVQQHACLEGRQNAMQRGVLELGAGKGALIGSGTSLLPETIEEMRKLFYSTEIRQTLDNSFSKIAPGEASQILLTLAGYPNLSSVFNELDSTQLQKICKKLSPGLTKPRGQTAHHNLAKLQAEEKLTSLVLKARLSTDDPVRALRNLKQVIYLTAKGWKTRLPYAARKELSALFETLNAKTTFTEKSAIERALQAPDVQETCAVLRRSGFNEQTIFDRVSALGIEPPETIDRRSTDELSSSAREVLFEKAAGKGKYTINTQTLINLSETSTWLHNRTYELAAPILIQQLKNTSKVRLHDSFEQMASALLLSKQEREFAALNPKSTPSDRPTIDGN